MQPGGYRRDGVEGGYAAIAQTDSPNMAALAMASAATGANIFDLARMGRGSADSVSRADAAFSASQQNKISNAIQIGDNTFAKAAIEDTKNQMISLGESLNAGKVEIEDVRTAFSGKGKESEAARKKVDAAVGKDATPEEKEKRLALLKTLSDAGRTIGGEDALSVLYGGKESLKKVEGAATADNDFLSVTRQTNRRDSDTYKAMEGIGEFMKSLGQFFQNPVEKLGGNYIPVKVMNNELNTNVKTKGDNL